MCTPESGSVVDCYNLSVDYEEKGDLQKALGGTANLLIALELFEKSENLKLALFVESGVEAVENCRSLSGIFLKKGEIYETLGGEENLLCALKLYEKSRRLCKALSGALGTYESRCRLCEVYLHLGDAYKGLAEQDLESSFSEGKEQEDLESSSLGEREVESPSREEDEDSPVPEKYGKALEQYLKCLELGRRIAEDGGEETVKDVIRSVTDRIAALSSPQPPETSEDSSLEKPHTDSLDDEGMKRDNGGQEVKNPEAEAPGTKSLEAEAPESKSPDPKSQKVKITKTGKAGRKESALKKEPTGKRGGRKKKSLFPLLKEIISRFEICR